MDMPALLDQLPVLSDSTRARLLSILDRQETTVSELCETLQLPQSTVSRHLKTLSDAGWVTSRRDGTSRFYSLAQDELPEGAQKLWRLVRDDVTASTAARDDERRLRAVLSRRRLRSEEFFSSAAGQWDRLRQALFGSVGHLHALLAWLDPGWVVGDLGCGTGQVTEALAPFVAKVVAVDASADMLAAARHRLRGHASVAFHQGSLECLPLEDDSLDAACVMLVLHHVPDPGRVLAEAARVLRPGGRLLVMDMQPHEREDYRQTMGHVWLGFSDRQMGRLMGAAGFDRVRSHALPEDPDASGPGLLATVGWRRTDAAARASEGQLAVRAGGSA
jgi:ArsR family transcriptional regulator